MAHYAFINDDNVVDLVIVGRDEDEVVDGISDWESYYGNIHGKLCLRTSYNTVAGVHTNNGEPFRGNYAGVGFVYDEALDAFIPPKPLGDYVLDEDTFTWQPVEV
jgi:hypothetical protein